MGLPSSRFVNAAASIFFLIWAVKLAINVVFYCLYCLSVLLFVLQVLYATTKHKRPLTIKKTALGYTVKAVVHMVAWYYISAASTAVRMPN